MLLDHIDFRVRSLSAVKPLYDALLPAMGYSKVRSDEDSASYRRPEETGAEPFFWFVEDAAHRPGETRVAFAAPTRADVDRLAAIARGAGAANFEAPELIPEYEPNYYAAFFEDSEGNKLEICCRKRE